MDWPRLDPSPWNLSFGAAAAAVIATAATPACGPVVIPEGETDTDPTAGECNDASDCPPGYYCANAACIRYYDYYCEAGCCYGDCYYYYECYSDADCGPDGKCTAEHQCVAVTVPPECEEALSVVPLELPQPEEPFVSLAFVDANGDAAEDLLVGRSGVAQLHLGPGDAPAVALPIPTGASVIDAVAGDFDGDGDADLVLATGDGHLVTLAGDGLGGFALAMDQDVSSPYGDLTALQWDGDGMLDVAGVGIGGSNVAMVHLGGGAAGFIGSSTLATNGDAVSLARLDHDANEYGDVVVQDAVVAQIFLGDPSGDVESDGGLPGDPPDGTRRLLAGPIDATGSDEVVGYTAQSDSLELVVWPNAMGFSPQLYRVSSAAPYAELGDFDGNGSSDVVIGNDELVTYLRGSPDGPLLLSCQSSFFSGMPLAAMAMGDFDGNGRADVAIESNGPVTVLLSQ